MDPALSETQRTELSQFMLGDSLAGEAAPIAAETARTLALTGLADILVFFGVLLVGFAYVWKRGDLDWVRAVAEQARQAAARPGRPPSVPSPPSPPPPLEQPPREPEPVGV
jgi:NADH-quinone oxidoreductase subunit A